MHKLAMVLVMMWLAQASAADALVDPTRPPPAVMEYLPDTQAEAEKPWVLTALQDNGKSGFAVVNGQMVQLGETYEGFKLASVKNGQALFVSKAGEKKNIGLGLSSFMVQAPSEVPVVAKKRAPGKKIKK